MSAVYHLRAPGTVEALCGTRRHFDGRPSRPALTLCSETAVGAESFLCKRCVGIATRRCGSVAEWAGVSQVGPQDPLGYLTGEPDEVDEDTSDDPEPWQVRLEQDRDEQEYQRARANGWED